MRARIESRAAYIFLLPWFVGFFGIKLVPLLVSFYLAFTNYNILSPAHWVGVRNFVDLFGHDPRFWKSVQVTLTYVGWSVPLVLVTSLALAVLLNHGVRGLAIYRTVFYIPSLIGSSVAIAFLWRQVFGLNGVFNQVVTLFGVQPKSWIANPSSALGTLIALNVWTFGAAMVIFLAALRQIPTELYEAARIDGSNAFQRFRFITLPLLTPVMFFNIVMQTLYSFQAFTQAQVISQGTGGPIDSTLLYTLYLYQRGFVNLQMGYAAAMAWLLVLTIAACTAVYFWSSKYWVFYDG
jgi:multiple sugar transport system permease protein